MKASGLSAEAIEKIKDSVDCNLTVFGKTVSVEALYAVVAISIVLIIGGILLIANIRKKHNSL